MKPLLARRVDWPVFCFRLSLFFFSFDLNWNETKLNDSEIREKLFCCWPSDPVGGRPSRNEKRTVNESMTRSDSTLIGPAGHVVICFFRLRDFWPICFIGSESNVPTISANWTVNHDARLPYFRNDATNLTRKFVELFLKKINLR
jgi:hypothetical protein